MSVLSESYRGRRVLVTGHTGFKGTWLTEWLVGMGAIVTGYALGPSTDPSLFRAIGLSQRINHVVGDVREFNGLERTILAAEPEIVFHLAASALVFGAYAKPVDTFETNVMGTVNLLEAARRCPSVKAILVVTSDKAYENSEAGRPFVETDPLGGREPYGASKAAAEIATAAYHSSYFQNRIAVATARAGNVIGGGDWAADRILADAIRALVRGVPVLVRRPESVRPWQHVLEPLSGYLWLGSRLLEEDEGLSGPWNFGPTDPSTARSVRWLIDRFLTEWGSGSWQELADVDGAPYESRVLRLNSRKAFDRLGWSPVWSAESAVQHTASWYRDFHQDPANARRLVEDELEAYQAEARAIGLPWAVVEEGR